MSLYTTAELLSFVQQQARRPVTDETMTSAIWYKYLSRGQAHWMRIISTHRPNLNMPAPTLLTTADGGFTYTFAVDTESPTNNVTPVGHVELYDGLKGRKLVPGSYWNREADFVLEGDTVRFPGGVQKTFGNGLYARWINPMPPDIGASQQPVLKPVQARVLIGWRALIFWASEDGGRDPTKWVAAEARDWVGEPGMGDYGILGMIKTQLDDEGIEALEGGAAPWWRWTDTGVGYSRSG